MIGSSLPQNPAQLPKSSNPNCLRNAVVDNRLRPTTWNVSGVLGYNYIYNETYWHETTGRVSYAQSIYDSTLDRSYQYDNVGRLIVSHSGAEARAHMGFGDWNTLDGPYSQGYEYDVWGNMTRRYGWGGEVQGPSDSSIPYYYSNGRNQRDSFAYDAAGNVTNDGSQSFSYDATGQQTYAASQGGGGSAPTFTNNPLQAGVTEVRALHITELREAINSLRTHLGMSAYSWQYSVTTNDWITANPILEMRTALDQALGAPSGGYSAGLAQGQPIKAIHIQELRDRVTAAWNAFSASGLSQSYDGDGLRVKKTEYGATTWYVRSSVLGGQVVAEIDGNAVWQRGYVYAGGSMMAVQQGGVFWTYEDPVTKSKRVCDVNGNTVSTVELDPWGADTNRSGNAAFQPRKYTSYDRDGNGSDEAMFRRYNRKNSRFDQPDSYDGSYDLTDPQSFNRYAYTQNDPVNFIDPSGLMPNIWPYFGAEHGWADVSAGFWGWGDLNNRPHGHEGPMCHRVVEER